MMANYVQTSAQAPGQVARTVTQRSGTYSGKGLLAAELIVGFVIIAIRIAGDYQINEGGAVKGNIVPPQGQYGPIAILAGLIGTFFLLSFLAAAGGTKAKIAVITGGTIILTLGVNTYRGGEITKLASTFGRIGTISVDPAQGTLPDIFGNAGTPGSAPPAGGFTSNPLPVAPGQPAGTGALPGSPDTVTIPFFGEPLTVKVPASVGNAEQWVKNKILHIFHL